MNQFAAIPCITVICYLFAEIFKAITKGKRNNLVPIICGVVGAVAGLIGFFAVPDFLPGENLFCAIATGIVSGFSATGVNQAYKQMTQKGEE